MLFRLRTCPSLPLSSPSETDGAKEAVPNRKKSIVEEFAANLEGEIRNPLKQLTREELLENVARFRVEKGLPEDTLPILTKGALVAQNPAAFETIPELDEAEKEVLREEVTHRWKHPWALYYTVILNSIAAAIQGWDQVG